MNGRIFQSKWNKQKNAEFLKKCFNTSTMNFVYVRKRDYSRKKKNKENAKLIQLNLRL